MYMLETMHLFINIYYNRSVSRESCAAHYACHCHAGVTSGHSLAPPVLLTAAGGRIVRQSSQPEACCASHCVVHQHTGPSVSLRQLRDPSDGIAGIAADSLRINGAMRQFKQVRFHSKFLYIILSYHLYNSQCQII